jgi:pentatricopeptide repeat protein
MEVAAPSYPRRFKSCSRHFSFNFHPEKMVQYSFVRSCHLSCAYFSSGRTVNNGRLFALLKELNSPNIEVNLLTLLREGKKSKDFAPAFKEAFSMVKGHTLLEDDLLTAINIFKLNKRPDLCFQALDTFSPQKLGVKHYSAVISACGHARQWEKALQVFDRMKRDGVEQNTITFNALISACEKVGKWEEALQLFHQMKETGGFGLAAIAAAGGLGTALVLGP